MPGCLTDVANLIYAMTGEPAKDLDERKVAEAIDTVKAKLAAKQFDDLWIPTDMIHDAEFDDQLAWLLLRYVHKQKGTTLRTLVQLPTPKPEYPELEEFDQRFKKHGCETFRDPASRNAKAIKATYHSN